MTDDQVPGPGDSAQAAFTDWVTSSYPALLRTAYLLTGDRGRAEDLVQTVLARIYLRWDRLDDVRRNGALNAYARTALTRQSISWWRRPTNRERVVEDLPNVAATADPYRTVDDRRLLFAALARLPKRQRAAVVLRYFDDLSEADIALVMGCSIGTVKSHTHRGLAALRLQLTDPDDVRLSLGESR